MAKLSLYYPVLFYFLLACRYATKALRLARDQTLRKKVMEEIEQGKKKKKKKKRTAGDRSSSSSSVMMFQSHIDAWDDFLRRAVNVIYSV